MTGVFRLRPLLLGFTALGLLGLVVGLATTGAGLVPGPTRLAADTRAGTGAYFSEPGENGADAEIRRKLIGMIKDSPANATIRMSVYLIGDPRIKDALVSAHKNGVKVKIIADHDSAGSDAFGALRKRLGTNPDNGSYAITCPKGRGCVGDNINHNKFVLFSATGGSRKALMQTSANLTPATADSGVAAFNDALVLDDEPDLYDAYLTRWTHMKRGDSPGFTRARGERARAYFFPSDKGRNPVVNILRNVRCKGHTEVRVAVMNIDNVAIAKRLRNLDDAGCRVLVVHTDMGKGDNPAMRALKRTPVGRYKGPVVDTHRKTEKPYVHSKYMLIDGSYNGVQGKRLWMGSTNYADNGLYHQDEAMIKLWDHPGIHDQYLANFGALQDRADGRWHDGRVTR